MQMNVDQLQELDKPYSDMYTVIIWLVDDEYLFVYCNKIGQWFYGMYHISFQIMVRICSAICLVCSFVCLFVCCLGKVLHRV